MPQITQETLKKYQSTLSGLEDEFREWRPHYQDLGKFLLPRRYQWLAAQSPLGAATGNAATEVVSHQGGRGGGGSRQSSAARARNEFILDSTGTRAARTLAAGMMNGIASPARPWFSLRLKDFPEDTDDYPVEVYRWLEEIERRTMIILAESNFYNALAVTFLDLGVFGTSATLIYKDFEKVIRFYNSPVGEFRLIQDDKRVVSGFARSIVMTVNQTVTRWGIENVRDQTKIDYDRGGRQRQKTTVICHLIEQNVQDDNFLKGGYTHREIYWEHNEHSGKVLSVRGFKGIPGIFPRWEIVGNDTYGTSPGMDALPDIIQLQRETKEKGASLAYMNRPPIVADNTFKQKAGSLLPGGQTYVPNSSQVGAKPVYTVNPPIAELSQDIAEVQSRIRDTFHNDLFRMISELDTVRSATEIDARREEKLVLLGPVLERFENEALDPALRQTVQIAKESGLLPPPPPGYEDVDSLEQLDVRYVSILSDAQRAAGTASVERFLQVIGNTAAAVPQVLELPAWDELFRDYAKRLNMPHSAIKSEAEVEEEKQRMAQQQNAEQMGAEAQTMQAMTGAAKNLSDVDVGGGQNAIQALIGG